MARSYCFSHRRYLSLGDIMQTVGQSNPLPTSFTPDTISINEKPLEMKLLKSRWLLVLIADRDIANSLKFPIGSGQTQ
jgi:hypothetical protein